MNRHTESKTSSHDFKIVKLTYEWVRYLHDGYCSDPGEIVKENHTITTAIVHPEEPQLPQNFFDDLKAIKTQCGLGSGYCYLDNTLTLIDYQVEDLKLNSPASFKYDWVQYNYQNEECTIFKNKKVFKRDLDSVENYLLSDTLNSTEVVE